MSQLRPFKTMYPGYFQTAYVTNNLDQAMKQLGDAYGIRDWWSTRSYEGVSSNGKTITIGIALAYVGDSQIEIIEPVAGAVGYYRTALTGSEEFQVKFHHLCIAFDTAEQYEAKVAELKLEGIDIPFEINREMNSGFGFACYGDFRHKCGHFLEYVWLKEEGYAWMSSVPRN